MNLAVRHQRAGRRRAGFTLAELLVTIGLVAFLASLLWPSLARGKARAHQAVCIQNLRQLGLAAEMYWDDHDGRTFRYHLGAQGAGDRYWFGWLERGAEGARSFRREAGVLYPYLQGRGVELCPSLAYHSRQFKLKAAGAAFGYGYNIHLSAPLHAPPFAMAGVANPAGRAVFGDAAQVNTFQAPASPSNPLLEEFYYLSAEEPTTHFRHGGAALVIFADLHVAAEKPAQGTLDDRMPQQRVARLNAEILK